MQINFHAYATDSVLAAQVDFEGERMSDALTHADAYRLEHVLIESLDGSQGMTLEDVTVLREELCLVAAAGPRGDPQRRVRTRPHPMRARVGPYEVVGYVHALPSADVIAAILRRPVIPMTEATVRFRLGDSAIVRQHDAVLVIRSQIDWLGQALDHEIGLAAARPVTAATDPHALDLTGEIFA